jgi:hypothetical protein
MAFCGAGTSLFRPFTPCLLARGQALLKRNQEMTDQIEQIAVFIDFENIARWAEEVFLDFELTPVIEYLHSRGALVIKRAYGEWSRFSNYRDEMM